MNLQGYFNRFQSVHVDLSRTQEIARAAHIILANWAKYTDVKNATGVPEHVTGVIHYRESDFDFETYLANGDPLFDHVGHPIQTHHVPKGLGPVKDWAEGAVLSYHHEGFDRIHDWTIANALYEIECYNGSGYLNRNIESPYLWAGTNQYTKGKYVSDGVFDPDAVDQQLGVVPILLALKEAGVDLQEKPPA